MDELANECPGDESTSGHDASSDLDAQREPALSGAKGHRTHTDWPALMAEIASWKRADHGSQITDHETPEWGLRMAGPWASKRDFVRRVVGHNNRPFVDLADEPQDAPEVEWLIEGLLPLHYLVVMGGDSKAGKTFFATALALSVATGTPFLGLQTMKRPVLWLSFEENPVERRISVGAWYSMGGARPEPMKFMTSYQPLYIDDPYALAVIAEWARGLDAGLIVVDPLHAAYSAGSISDGSTARRVLAGLKRICSENNLSVLVLHHLTKQSGAGLVRERMSESAQILAAASMDWLMESRDALRSSCAERRGKGRGWGSEEEVQSDSLNTPHPTLNAETERPYHIIDRGPDGTGIHVYRVDLDGARTDLGPQDEYDAKSKAEQAALNADQRLPITDHRSPITDAPITDHGSPITARTLLIKSRGRGAYANRVWNIESPSPMVYRLAGQTEPGLSLTEQRILDLLAIQPATSAKLAEIMGIPVKSVRNHLTMLLRQEKIAIKSTVGRCRTYCLPQRA